MKNDGVDLKYGEIVTEHGSIPEDEPVFLIRARDTCAVAALTHYREIAYAHGASDEFLEDVQEAIRAFESWRGCRKVPD